MKIFIFLTVFLLSCSSENENYIKNTSDIVKYGGWAGAPDALDKKPHDYFFLTQEGNVQSLLKPKQMKQACLDSVRKNGSHDLIYKAIKDALDVNSCQDGGNFNAVQKTIKKLKKTKPELVLKTCQSTSTEIEWKECKCLIYINIQGGKEEILKKYDEN